jgi:glycine amidinotransferase
MVEEIDMADRKKTVVNSWNEWDPLRHVIVGRADGTMMPAPEPAVEWDFRKDGVPAGMYGRFPKEMEDKANEQLDNFTKILEKRGIRVDRPTVFDFSKEIQTPDWKQKSSFGCMPPRDVLLTVGNEIVEATMSYRTRWFEYIVYRPLLQQYFQEDLNFRWISAPKPRLTERTYKKDFWKEYHRLNEEEKLERGRKGEWATTEVEPLFDAASVARFGKDLFVEHSTVTNLSGIEWLRRQFPNHRVHKVMFDEEWPCHIDATFVPLRPGLVLQNRKRHPLIKETTELLRKNGWESVTCAEPAHKDKAYLSHCSIWLSMNLLVLDPKTVCVESSEKAQMEQLDKLGFEVIPVPFWDVSAFGGGLHCATADVYREGKCEDYFPNQIEGF